MASSVQTQREKRVCVTGASGFIGSWIVRLLLQRGYHVRGTVRNLGDVGKTQHLMGLEGADTQLELFEADLLDYQSLASAISTDFVGVFHTASPLPLASPKDPQRELIDPAVDGTLNVLKASHAAKVQRVVLTSSRLAMLPSPNLPPEILSDLENIWTDVEHCRESGAWYPMSKVLAEKAAWKFAEDTGLDVVVINPGLVWGKPLQPKLNTSCGMLLKLLQGEPLGSTMIGIVDVEDVAQAHILLYESPHAQGRHVCALAMIHADDLAEEVAKMYPQYKVPRSKQGNEREACMRLERPSTKLMRLGLKFIPLERIIEGVVSSLQDKELIPV